MIIVPREEKEKSLDKFYVIRDRFKESYQDTSSIEKMISVLEKDDETILESLSLEERAYFFRLVNFKYYEEIFYNMLIEIFSSNQKNIINTYIKTNLIPSKYLDDDKLLELILNQDDDVLNGFSNYKFDNTSLDAVSKILNKVENLDVNFFMIQCDSKKSFIAQNPDYCKKIVSSDNFIKQANLIEPIYLKKIFYNCKSEFLKFSIDDKIEFTNEIKDNNFRKELFVEFDLKEYPNKLISYNNLVPLLDKNIIIDKIIDGDISFIKFLSTNEQLELLNNEKIDPSIIAFSLKDETIINNLSINPDLIPLNVYLYVYKKGRNIKIEEYIKNKLLFSKTIDDSNIIFSLVESPILNSFSEEEINSLLNKIKKIDNAFSFFNLKEVSNKLFYNGIIGIIVKNDALSNCDKKATLSFTKLCEYPQEYREYILSNLDKCYLVLSSLTNNEDFNKLKELLEWDKDFLKLEKFDSSNSYPGINIDKKINYDEKYLVLKDYLSEEQLNNLFFISDLFIENSKVIKSEFITYISKNPDKIKKISLIRFLPSSKQKDLLSEISIDKFVETIPSNFSKYFDTSIVDDRYNEIINYINLHNVMTYTITDIFTLFNEKNKFKFIDDVLFFDFAFYIYRNAVMDKIDKKRIFRRIFSNKEKLLDFKEDVFTSFNSEEYELFTENSSLGNIIKACIITNNDYLKTSFYTKIKENFDLLLEPNVYLQIDNLSNYLDDEVIKYIKDNCVSRLNKIPFYSELKNNDDLSLSSMLSIIYGTYKDYINGNTIDYIKKAYSKNKYFFSKLDFRLFRNDIYSLGEDFVSRLVRYPETVNQIYNIFNTDKGNELKNIILYLNDLDISNEVYSSLLNIIIYQLNTSDEVYEYDNPKALIDYTVSSKISNNPILSKLKYDSNYLDNKEKIINRWIEKENDLDKLKELVYEKIYGISSSTVKKIINIFKEDYESVKEYLDNNFCDIYISIHEAIEELNDNDEVYKFCNEVKTRYTVIDYSRFKDSMKKAYFKLIEKQNNKNKTITNIKEITIGDTNVEVEEYVSNIGIFTHSTCAYGEMKLIDDDYYISWNNNPNTENNGICTAYISDSNLSTAPVADTGILFGFTNIKSNSIGSYAPYDLNSYNNFFGLFNNRDEFYVSLDNLPSYTRNGYNEVVLYRNINNVNVQPDCVIIFEDMPESIKKNSIKAVEDFRKHGIELKIVYIDRVKVLFDEVFRLSNDIKEYLHTYDLDLFKKIIDRYNTNMCSLIYLDNVDKDEIFITDSMHYLVSSTIEHIMSIDDEVIKSANIIQFIDIIEKEDYKYKIVQKQVNVYKNKFGLYTPDVKKKIKELEKILMSNYKKEIGLRK